MSQYYLNWNQVPKVEALPGMFRTVISGEKAMLSRIQAKAGVLVPEHRHASEQVAWLMTGKMRVATAGGEQKILGPGDVWLIPANALHSAEYLEDTEMIEAFSPIRLEFLTG